MPEMALNNSDLNHAPMKKAQSITIEPHKMAPHDVQL